MKVNKIIFENFKFFYKKEIIELSEKNMLLYGENGAGKSSIYWGLYTLLQSSHKSNDEIKKYFDINNSANLVNRFIPDGEESSITLEIVDETKGTQSYKISINKFQTDNKNIKEANQACDFINYRLLARLYDFRNSENINLFSFFEKEIMQYIYLIEDKKNVKEWWDYLKVGMNPRPHMHTEEYRIFTKNLEEFNSEFEKFIRKITEASNKYLQEKFNQKFKIIITYTNATYDDFIEGKKSRNHKTLPPKIKLTVESLHDKLDKEKKEIPRPHTFLNEAKLTSIALSIRFAILDEKLINDDVCKILVLDDLLISLDMSHRNLVLDIILDEFDTFQLIVMTHDKLFFNIMKNKLKSRGASEKNWIIKEMYEDEKGGIPKPALIDSKNNLDLAKKYLLTFDYPACANYLRKECERLLKVFLPEFESKYFPPEGGLKYHTLEALIDKFNRYYVNSGGNKDDFIKLKEYKDLLLNPLAHDNIDTPIYKKEVISIFDLIEKLSKIKNTVLCDLADVNSEYIYLTEVDPRGINFKYKIQLKEKLRAIKSLNNGWNLNSPKCIFIERVNEDTGVIDTLNKEIILSRGYEQIRHYLKIKDKSSPTNLLEIITNCDGVQIRTLLNKKNQE